MRIAYLAQCRIPSDMANSVQVMKMCAAFARKDHDVTLFATKGGSSDVDPFKYYGVETKFRIRCVPMAAIRGVAGVKFARDCVQVARNDVSPDVFYVRHVYGLWWALGTGVPVIYEAHALPRSRIHTALLRWAFRRPNFRHVVAISEALRQDYLACFPALPTSKIRVAHDGADLPPARQGLATEAPRDRLKVGYLGALYPGKGMELIAVVAPRLPDVEFHVVGGDVDAVRLWKHRVPAPNIYFHGYVPHAETSRWIEAFAIALLPLQRQVGSLPGGGQDIARWTSPLKLFEYMAHGKPIIASDLPVLREVIDPERNGLVASADRPEEWVRALRRLAADPDLRRRLGENARRDVERAYTWETRTERVLNGLDCAWR